MQLPEPADGNGSSTAPVVSETTVSTPAETTPATTTVHAPASASDVDVHPCSPSSGHVDTAVVDTDAVVTAETATETPAASIDENVDIE